MQGRLGAMDSELSIAVGYRSAAAARRDLSCDRPSSQSNQRCFQFLKEDKRWEEANRSLWPNPEFHGGSLPAMPALGFPKRTFSLA